MTPAPTHSHPRFSRTACHTIHAPPISASAATTNKSTDRAIVIASAMFRRRMCLIVNDARHLDDLAWRLRV